METLRVVALEGELEDDESMVLVVVVYIDWSMTRLSTYGQFCLFLHRGSWRPCIFLRSSFIGEGIR